MESCRVVPQWVTSQGHHDGMPSPPTNPPSVHALAYRLDPRLYIFDVTRRTDVEV